MTYKVEAIYEGGVFRPLVPVKLPDRQRVNLTIDADEETAERELAAWEEVYAGLSDQQIAELDSIIKDRSHFMRQGA